MQELRVCGWRRRANVASCAIALALLMVAGGCKTSDDAAATATQLTSTASLLTGYYTALDTLLNETDQLYQIQGAINTVTPYDAQTRALVADTKSEIESREKLAKALTELAQEYAKLSGSAASADAEKDAGNLETALAGLKQTKVSMSASSVNLMKDAVGEIVKAIQERKEREASAAIDKFTAALDSWFQNEEPYYNTIGANYAGLTKSLAHTLVSKGQVDSSSFLSTALSPYGLTAQITDPTLKASIDNVMAAQIDQKATALSTAQAGASASMEKALAEMSSRIHLVATEKPMAIRAAPVTLAEVQSWIALVPQIAGTASTATGSASSGSRNE
jgi:hypothetical protein